MRLVVYLESSGREIHYAVGAFELDNARAGLVAKQTWGVFERTILILGVASVMEGSRIDV